MGALSRPPGGREIEERHGSLGTRGAWEAWGPFRGPRREIEERHGSPGGEERGRHGGPFEAPGRA
jgi:hypothetical protein